MGVIVDSLISAGIEVANPDHIKGLVKFRTSSGLAKSEAGAISQILLKGNSRVVSMSMARNRLDANNKSVISDILRTGGASDNDLSIFWSNLKVA